MFSFVLSMVALAVSGANFYLSNIAKGELRIFMPDQIAVLAGEDRLLLQVSVPAVIYNTGAPNNWKSIENLTVAAQIKDDSRMTDAILQWKTTSRMLSKLDFEKQYPESKNVSAEDYLVYESRKLPFSISGRQTVNRIYDFVPGKPAIPILKGHFLIEMRVDVTTVDKVIYPSKHAVYCLAAKNVELSAQSHTYQWASRVPDIQTAC